jgi:hypothetical protein
MYATTHSPTYAIDFVYLTAKSKWRKRERRRRFFDEFAKSKKFDRYDAESWYSITRKDIKSAKVCVICNLGCKESNF